MKSLTYVLIFAQFLALMGDQFWLTELFSHYAPYYGILAALLLIEQSSRPKRRRKIHWPIVGLLSLVLTWNLGLTAPYVIPYLKNTLLATQENSSNEVQPNGAQSKDALRIISQNVYYQNTDLEELIHSLEALDPQIIVIHEASQSWQALIPELKENYPWVHLSHKTGIHGVLIASQIAGQFEEIPLGDHVGVRFIADNEDFQVLGVHPEAPLSPAFAKARTRQFDDIVHFVHSQSVKSNGSPLPTVVIGDFNCTPWSPAFKELLKESGLRDARVGLDFSSTWHARNPFFKLIIDHALITPEWTVTDFKTHQTKSADHKAIQVDLQLLHFNQASYFMLASH